MKVELEGLGAKKEVPPYPRCPHCYTQPCPIIMGPVSFPGTQAVVFTCGLCASVLSVQVTAYQTRPKAEEPRIMLPV